MSRQQPPRQQTANQTPDRVAGVVWGLILLTVTITPLVVVPGMRDAFRPPKTIVFHAMMLLTAGGATSLLLVRGRGAAERIARYRLAVSLALIAVIWTALVSMLAVEPAVAYFAPLTVFCHAVLFIATIVFARGTFLPLASLFLPAAANAAVAFPQALHLWSPIPLEQIPPGRLYVMGFLGNPDYLGTYLIVPSVAAMAAAFAFRRKRLIFGAISVLLLGGAFLSQSVTVIGALGMAILSFASVVRTKGARLAVIGTILLSLIVLAAHGPTRARVLNLRQFLRENRLNDLTSLRLGAFVVAGDMFRERPLLGVGPGGFEHRYMSHKLAADERFPQWIRLGNNNFGEVHNDHLQLLAETGLPGSLLFLAALAQLATLSFRRPQPDRETSEFARLFAFPAAVGFGVVALGQFPLYLIASSSSAVFAAALAQLWSDDADH